METVKNHGISVYANTITFSAPLKNAQHGKLSFVLRAVASE